MVGEPEAGSLFDLPQPQGTVNDFAGVLSADQTKELRKLLEQFLAETEVPVVVAIVRNTEPLKPSEYAFVLYNHWGIGRAEDNMGALVLLCLKEKRLESEIGLGLEKYLPEEVGDRIVQEGFLPLLKEGRVFEGLKAGTEKLLLELKRRLPTVS